MIIVQMYAIDQAPEPWTSLVSGGSPDFAVEERSSKMN